METMDKKKRDRYIKSLVFDTLILIGCAVFIFMFISPKYSELSANITKTNKVIEDIDALNKNGLDKDSFSELLTRLWRKQEISDVIFTNAGKLNRVLTKPTTVKKNYADWLIEENGKVSIIDSEIQQNERILGNIIPLFVGSSSKDAIKDIDNQLTFSSFVSYIEKDILGKYALVSYAPIGISNISFSDKKDTSINIGSFKISFDFKGKNSNITSLIDALQKSGKLTIQNGKLISDNTDASSVEPKEKWLSDLSNLLVGINALSLWSIPIVPNMDNNGSITLEFYVEGMNYQKIVLLRSIMAQKFEWLDKLVREKGSLCSKWWNPLCDDTATVSAITNIKSLSRNLTSIRPKLDALKKGDRTIDVNKEMESLSDIKTTLDSIEMTYSRNNLILEKAKK
jgi:hypothetical protein